ncbi:hypothetical protein P8452_07348 [Trifolium repens]|nr:hypothetical protein P8452_07348 [Trifolium repens]
MLEIMFSGVKQIVAMEEGSMEHSFHFPQLNTFKLVCLTKLASFYGGKYSLDCPSLKVLDVSYCAFNHLDWFSIEKLSRNLEELIVNRTELLEILNQENIFQKVQTLYLQCLDETPATFLNEYSHTIFPNLETFQVRNSSFETLFPTTGFLSMQISKQIKTLTLLNVKMLKYIWQEDFPLDHPLLQDLHKLSVGDCPSLISLVPSSTSFTNLTILIVVDCKELNYLITSSTAKSLIQLKMLSISNCEKMLDVVKIDDEKAEEDIIFQNLEYMEFINLSSLGSFCYGNQTFMFPSLLQLMIEGCPQMMIFSSRVTVAPYLTEIEVGKGTTRWKGDINTTIQHLFQEKEVIEPDGDTFADWPVDLDTKPEELEWWMNAVDSIKSFGNEYYKKQDYKMAIKKYSKALRYLDMCSEKDGTALRKTKSQIFTNRSACKLKLGDLDGALKDANSAMHDGDNAKALFRKGQVYMLQNELDAALESFKKALELEPNDGGIKRQYAIARKKEVLRSNALNETIISSHLQDDELGGQDGIDANPEGPPCHIVFHN